MGKSKAALRLSDQWKEILSSMLQSHEQAPKLIERRKIAMTLRSAARAPCDGLPGTKLPTTGSVCDSARCCTYDRMMRDILS